MPHPHLIFSQSDYFIQIVAINSHTEWQTVQIQISWLLRSQLIWIYTFAKVGYIRVQQDKGQTPRKEYVRKGAYKNGKGII